MRIINISTTNYTIEDYQAANIVYSEYRGGFYIYKNRYGKTGEYTKKELEKFIKQDKEAENPPKHIALEDIATDFASEFVKEAMNELQICSLRYTGKKYPSGKDWYVPFLRMNYARRRKIVEKILDKIRKTNKE